MNLTKTKSQTWPDAFFLIVQSHTLGTISFDVLQSSSLFVCCIEFFSVDLNVEQKHRTMIVGAYRLQVETNELDLQNDSILFDSCHVLLHLVLRVVLRIERIIEDLRRINLQLCGWW